jgi:hypothetical protein
VADALGVDLPWEIDGISVFGPSRATTQKRYASAGDKIIDGSRWLPEVLRGTLATMGLEARTPEDLFLVGPYPELLGQAVPPGDATVGSATVDDLGAFDDVQPRLGTVPALVTGSLQHDRPPAAVAVALNGTIVATSQVYGDDPARFATVLPDTAFVAGANRLEVLAVGPDGALTRLRVRG